ncbi:hypothetical protein HXX76_012870 [Chlamydomonas incerta]|uniref:Uncharacterized protein n=1 Tax=Chlamydomonas incerta TaxID=51695 RepID=A0A835SGK7_CHLIN|nr:hypothetical protein HXX76_012870 [Chlamydomonas incerta]|eukprot:KAG2426818.1 hypothetical protein HXX76_012870 [Chlamydomonas incerta]
MAGGVLRSHGTMATEPAEAEPHSHSISVNTAVAFSPPAAPYVNTRRGSMLGSPYQDLAATSFEEVRPTTPSRPALSQVEEDSALRRTPSPRVSQHPSVAALYQYAQAICTPVSCNSKPVRSSTPPECAELVSALEGAVQGVDADAAGGELCSSFGSWLAGMGLDAGLLPATALAKMQLLWEKAKEATQLQAVVEQLKDAELQLAQQEAEDNARHVGMLLAENEDLLGTKAQLQERLSAAEQRLAQLATAAPVPTPYTQAAQGEGASPSAAFAATAESPAKAHSWAYGEHREAASMGLGHCSPAFGAMASPSTAAFAPTVSPQQAQHCPDGAAAPAASVAASDFSISVGSMAQPYLHAASPALPTPHSPSNSVNGPAAPAAAAAAAATPVFAVAATPGLAAAATPGLSFTSAVSQLPFGAWGAGGGFGGDDLGVVASPACGMGFGGFGTAVGFDGAALAASPNEAQSSAAPELLQEAQGADCRQAPASWPLSPGMAVSTYSAQTETAQTGAVDEATSGDGRRSSAQPTPISHAAPQLSAGLSTVSRQQPPAVGYESWRGLQEAQSPEAAGLWPSSLAASPASVQAPATEPLPSPQGFAPLPSPQAAGAMPSPKASSLQSPQVSAGLSVVSRSPAPVPFGAWSNAQQDDSQGAQCQSSGFDFGAPTHSQPAFPASPGSFASTPAVPSSPAASSPLPSAAPDAAPGAASTAATTAGAAIGHDSPSSAGAQLRSNPLFEYEMESPAPHTPLPTRSDGLLGPVPAPEPSPEPAFPSLASTPMTFASAAGRSPGGDAEDTAEPMDYSPAPAHLPFGLEAVMESPAPAGGSGSPGPVDDSFGGGFGGGFGDGFGGAFGGGGFFAADDGCLDDLGDMPSPPAASALSLPARAASPAAAAQAFGDVAFEACLPTEEQAAPAAAVEEGPAEAASADAAATDGDTATVLVDAAAVTSADVGATEALAADEGAAVDGSQLKADGCSAPVRESHVPAVGPIDTPDLASVADVGSELVGEDAAAALPQTDTPVEFGSVRLEDAAAEADLQEQPETDHPCVVEPRAEHNAAAAAATTEPAAVGCYAEPTSPAAANYVGLGDVGSPPCAGAVQSPVGSAQASAPSPVQSPAVVGPPLAAAASPSLEQVTSVPESSPARLGADSVAPVQDQEEPAASSPAAEQQAPAPGVEAADAPAAEAMSPVPAGPLFEAPASGASSAVKPSTPGGGEGCADGDGGAHSYPNTPSGAWPASPTSTMYATPLEAFATPQSLASFYTAAHMTALRMLSAMQTPATGNNGNPSAAGGIPTPVASFSFGMMGPAAGAAGLATPGLTRGFPAMLAAACGGGDAAAPGFAGGEFSPAEAQAQPFAGAGAGCASFGSPLPLMALTPVQMRTLDDLASQVLAAMSPSLLARGSAQLDEDETETEASAANSSEEAGHAGERQEEQQLQHTSPAATALRPAVASPIAFGGFAQLLSQLHSPLPVAHRREALVDAAARSAAAAGAGSSAGAAASSESNAASPPAAAIAAPAFLVPGSPAAFNFAKLVAQLHSPMPLAHMPRRAAPSSAAAGAPGGASAQSPPAASGPSQASAALPASPAAFNLAAMLAHLQSPLPQPVAARRMAASCAAEGAAAPTAAPAAAAAPAPAALPGSPAAFNFAHLLTQLHSPLPMHRLSRASAATSQPSSSQAAPKPQQQRFQQEQTAKEEQTAAATEAAGAAPDEAVAAKAASDSSEPVTVAEPVAAAEPVPVAEPVTAPEPFTVADAMPNFAKLMAFLNGNGQPPASPAPARAAAARAAGDSNAAAQDDADQNAAPAAAAPVDEVAAAAAMFSFASLIAQLHSPMPNGAALALVPNPGAIAASHGAGGPALQHADASGAGAEADSPAAMAGAMSHGGGGVQQDSPANSEAASFGFSTAAKLSTRVTPSTTPGGGNASFMRWAKETAPPTFRLDSDVPGGNGRSRLSRTPPTPVSFSFGGPGAADDGATPVAHGGFRGRRGAAAAAADDGAGEVVLAQPVEQHTPSSADVGPRSPVMSLGFNFHAAADGSQSPAFIFGNGAAAAASPHSPVFMLAGSAGPGAMPHSPMFMMAAPGGGGPMPHSPMFMLAAAGYPNAATSNAPHSPAFSFGHAAADASCPMTPGFGFANAAAAAAASPQSPAFTFGGANGSGAAAPHSPAFSFGNQLTAAAPGAAAGTPVAFLGGRPYMLARAASTPTAARGSARGESAGTPGARGAVAGEVPPSPTPSLGFWMMVPRGGAAMPGSPAPSDLSFAFGDLGGGGGGCVVGTPVLGGMMPGAGAEHHMSPVAAGGAAWEQLVGASPIWSLAAAAESDHADAPGAAARPPSAAAAAMAVAAAAGAGGVPAFWSSLLGSLHSPMPMMVNPRRGAFQQPALSEPAAPAAAAPLQSQLRFEEDQLSEAEQHSAAGAASMDPPSLDTLPTAAGTTFVAHGAATHASGVSAATADSAGSTFSFTSAAVPQPLPQLLEHEEAGQAGAVAAGEEEVEEEEDQDTPREAVLPPPSYEDLPDLIARGLCMSVNAAPAPLAPVLLPEARLLLQPAESLAASALDACSSVGENPTPFSERLAGVASVDEAVSGPALLAAAGQAAAAPAPGDVAALGGVLFTPVRRVTGETADLLGSGAAAAAAGPFLEALAVQSVSDSSRSGLDAEVSTAGMEAGRTTDDAATTPSRVGPGLTAASGCAGAEADAPSVHSSPVFSFGQPASSAGEPSVVDATSAAAPPRLVVVQEQHDTAGLSSPPPPGAATTPVSLRPRMFGAGVGSGSGSPGLHVVMSPAATLLRRAAAAAAAAGGHEDDGGEDQEAVVVVEMPDVRDSIRGFLSSANSTPQQQPPSTGAAAAARDRAERAAGGNPFLFASSGAASAAGPHHSQDSGASASINFSADAVQRLLFAGADAVADSATTQPAAAPSPQSSYSCDSDIAPLPEDDGDGTGGGGATPHMTYTITAAPGSPVLSSRPSVYAGLPTPGCLTPFSYMGPNSLPTTPLTADLASAAKGAAAGAGAAGVASASKAMGSSSGGGAGAARHHAQPFWAPNASGPVGGCLPSTSGERVTLEVLNRRICANADLLLDFQGSPGRQSMPGASASGATPPRTSISSGGGMPQHRGPAALFISPGRKSTGGGVTAAASGTSILTGTAAAAAPPAPAAAPAASLAPGRTTVSTAAAAAQADAAAAAAAARTRLLLSGSGVPVQQLVAASLGSALASSGGTAQGAMSAAAAAAAHLPLSQRLGLWHAATLPAPFGVAAWGVPLAWAGMPAFAMQPMAAGGAANPAPRGSGGGAAAAQQQPQAQAFPPAVQPQPQAHPAPAVTAVGSAAAAAPSSQIPAKPAVTSRDVQTTPSLAAKPNAAGTAAKPAFRSRIPTPGSRASSAAAGAAAHAPAIHSTATSGTFLTPAQPAGPASRTAAAAAAAEAAAMVTPVMPPRPAQSPTPGGGASSDDESSLLLSSPAERVVRRRRLLTSAAAAGGPQRVPVATKRPAAGPPGPRRMPGGGGGGRTIGGLDEDEVRRRAHVLGMRISPYLRPKKK